MKFNSELFHMQHPHRSKIVWGAFYIVLGTVLVVALYLVTDHIKTHTVATGGIVLSTPYSKYLLGEKVSFVVKNNYNSTTYITNQCPAEPLAVYRQDKTGWVRLHDTALAEDCPDEDRQVSIPANSEVTLSLAPWHHLFTQAGNYRLAAVIEGYNVVPYVDFQIIAPFVAAAPTPAAPTTTNTSGSQSTTSKSAPASQPSSNAPSSAAQPPVTAPAAKTITLHVNKSGVYDLTSITLNAGDSIQFVYSSPISNEIRTRFTAISPTTTTLSSVTLDEERTTRTIRYTTPGKWSFKADDHSGNTGTLVVN